MSLWDWLLAAWIYEEMFDNDSDNTSHNNNLHNSTSHDNSSHNNTRDYDSSCDYDDYEEDY